MKLVKKIISIIIFILLISWLGILVRDYFKAQEALKPLICISEETKTINNGEYYECISLGYKYYEYTKDGKTSYGLNAIIAKNNVIESTGE